MEVVVDESGRIGRVDEADKKRDKSFKSMRVAGVGLGRASSIGGPPMARSDSSSEEVCAREGYDEEVIEGVGSDEEEVEGGAERIKLRSRLRIMIIRVSSSTPRL